MRIKKADKESLLLYLSAFRLIGVEGFEPPTPWSQTKCSSQAELHSVEREGDFIKVGCLKQVKNVSFLKKRLDFFYYPEICIFFYSVICVCRLF